MYCGGKHCSCDGQLNRLQCLTGNCNDFSYYDYFQNFVMTHHHVELDFEQNPDSFCLLSDKAVGNYVIELEDFRLKVDRIIPGDSIMNFYRASLQKKIQPRLPIDRSMLKTYTVTSGTSDLSEYNIITGAHCAVA